MSSTHNIFNVPEATGKDEVALETTAAEARISAANPQIAREMERNASKEQEAAEQVASIAKTLGSDYTGEPTTAIDQFKGDATRTTNAAVAEGKHDMQNIKVASAGYIEQAKALAASAFETAQSYLPTSVGGASVQEDKTATEAGQQGQGFLASVEATAGSVYNAMSDAAQPHIERAKEAAQPHVEQAKEAAQGYMGTAGTQGTGIESKLKPASEHNIAASSAPLESGPHTVESPYPPQSSAVKGADIAASGAKPAPLHN